MRIRIQATEDSSTAIEFEAAIYQPEEAIEGPAMLIITTSLETVLGLQGLDDDGIEQELRARANRT